MKIILAETAGFCFGVKRAVDMAYKHENTTGTYTFGPIIHNEVVINELIEKGIHPIEEIKDEPVERLIIRSHGVSPTIYEQGEKKGAQIVDATCPYVKKIHNIVQKYSQNNYHIIIVGNENHPEIQGINGWAENKCVIIKDVEALKSLGLRKEAGRYLVVSQTTYKKEVVDEIVSYLKEQNYDFEYINTICNATKERQEEALSIAKKVDCMLVLGSQKSSNTLKLYEISRDNCQKSYCISGAEELTPNMIEGCQAIGITAGASTPHSVIQAVLQKLEVIGA